MAVAKGFGAMLRDARVSQGLNYGTVSRKLRIRPDILQAIEEEDFSKMPPKSYARGMISAYAHLLHLNPDKIIDDYLSADLAAGGSRSSRSSRRGDATSRSRGGYDAFDDDLFEEVDHDAAVRARIEARRARSGRAPQEQEAASRRARGSANARRGQVAPRHNVGSSALHTAGSLVAGAAGAAVNAVGSAASRHKKVDINHSIYADQKKGSMFDVVRGLAHGGSSHWQKAPSGHGGGMSFQGVAQPSGGSKVPLIIGAVVILLVLFVASRFLFGGSDTAASSAQSTTSAASSASVQISGLTDPGAAGTTEKEDTVVAIAPSAAVFTYQVADGQDCYVEIYLDGSSSPSVADTLTGPARGTYDVTGTLSIVTSNPSALTLKLDGATVEMEDDNGDGVYTYNVDFPEILAAWKEAHVNNGTGTESAESAERAQE